MSVYAEPSGRAAAAAVSEPRPHPVRRGASTHDSAASPVAATLRERLARGPTLTFTMCDGTAAERDTRRFAIKSGMSA